ncbi:Chloroperoxidase [Auriculariales sp. MPI-PUGE-AT-0066]|nr:Chloroperoxidase [Auriculariales sp. MPI-PUGE-AT-0066]
MARKFVAPAVPTNFTSKMIPDEHHQFRPPCVYDKRGPCPALNTLANHGYIPRNGVATAEQIIEAVVEGFGMHPDVAGFLVGYGVLTRGNANLAMLSIGDADDELIPALPGCLDGKVAGGISKPGRFEGDISLTRSDAGSSPTGDAAKFNPALYDQLLLYVGKYGNSTTGVDPTTINEAIVTNTVFEKFIPARFAFEQKNDKSLNFNIGRLLVDFAATGLILELFPSFPNGVKENLTVSQLDSFFRNERFPENWVRRAPLANLGDLAPTAGGLIVGSGVLPGRNVEGKFVQDKLDANTLLCDGYTSILQHDIPEILTSAAVTGVLRRMSKRC